MFAPYCPTCRRRVLLGPARIAYFSSPGDPGHDGLALPAGTAPTGAATGASATGASATGGAVLVIVECFCGTLVDVDSAAPRTPPAQRDGHRAGTQPRPDVELDAVSF